MKSTFAVLSVFSIGSAWQCRSDVMHSPVDVVVDSQLASAP
jgi:hypothetical protein